MTIENSMPEAGDQQKPDFIELEAPEYLAPGQNFFDQPPFDSLKNIAIKHGIEIKDLRYLLSSITHETGSGLSDHSNKLTEIATKGYGYKTAIVYYFGRLGKKAGAVRSNTEKYVAAIKEGSSLDNIKL